MSNHDEIIPTEDSPRMSGGYGDEWRTSQPHVSQRADAVNDHLPECRTLVVVKNGEYLCICDRLRKAEQRGREAERQEAIEREKTIMRGFDNAPEEGFNW